MKGMQARCPLDIARRSGVVTQVVTGTGNGQTMEKGRVFGFVEIEGLLWNLLVFDYCSDLSRGERDQ